MSALAAAAAQLRHPAALSSTALRAYDECPRRYAYQYLEKIHADEQASPHLIFGNALHKALAHLFRMEPERRDTAAAHQALRHFWLRQRRRDEAFLSQAEEREWGLDAVAALTRFCEERAEELELKPLAIEEKVWAPLPGDHAVVGRVDRVERIEIPDRSLVDPETGEVPAEAVLRGLRVTDYKSGRCHFQTPDELALDRGAQVYALAATRTFRSPVLEVRFLYLRENKALTWTPEREDLLALEQTLAKAIDEIEGQSEFEACPDFHCRWCGYRELCPHADRATFEQLDANPETVF